MPLQVTITTHDGVSIDSSDDEEDDDEEDDEDDDDDDDEVGEDDEDEEDEDEEDEEMGVFSDVDQSVEESARAATDTTASNNLFGDSSSNIESLFVNSYYLNR